MEKDNPFLKLKEQVIEYVNLQIEVAKLTAYEKISKIIAVLSSVIVILFLLFFALLFVFFATAYFLSGLLNSNAAGFGIVALFYVILLLFFLGIRKKYFERKITDAIADILTDDDNDEEQTH